MVTILLKLGLLKVSISTFIRFVSSVDGMLGSCVSDLSFFGRKKFKNLLAAWAALEGDVHPKSQTLLMNVPMMASIEASFDLVIRAK